MDDHSKLKTWKIFNWLVRGTPILRALALYCLYACAQNSSYLRS